MRPPERALEIIELMFSRVLVAVSLAASLHGERAPDFPPFDYWRRAVVAGDEKTLEELYSRRPPARILRGQTETSNVTEECRYWTGLKAAGLSSVNPKLLSLKISDGKAQSLKLYQSKAEALEAVGLKE